MSGGGARRFLFVGGGTGGHLAPALGIAEALHARGHACRFLTSGRAVERDFLSGVGEHVSLGLEGRRLPPRLAFPVALLRARRESARFRPDVVVCLGGLCGGAALGARRGRPLILLEGNRVAGKAVRWMQRWARTTLTQYADTAGGLRRNDWIGPVSRAALAPLPREEARRRLGLRASGEVLLVMGGSQGARDLNEAAAALAPELAMRSVQVLALAGAGKAAPLRAALAAAGVAASVREHCTDMGAAYSAADLALTRGGAATMAELWLHALPAAVVPYAHHRDRQQEHNARALEPGVVVVGELDAAARSTILALLDDPAARAAMGKQLRESAPPDGLPRAVALLEEIAAETS